MLGLYVESGNTHKFVWLVALGGILHEYGFEIILYLFCVFYACYLPCFQSFVVVVSCFHVVEHFDDGFKRARIEIL
jgi:hypothetical protein